MSDVGTPERWLEHAEGYRKALCEDTLPFWIPACVADNGGFGCFLDRAGRRYDQDKGVWHQGRFTWLLGTLARVLERREEWVALCDHGVRFLREHCIDPEDGRYWFHLDGENRPLRKRRYVFSEAFAAQAYAAHGALMGDERSRDDAWSTFERMTAFMTTPGALPAKSTGVRPLKAIGAPMIRIGVAQAMRALGEDPRLDAEVDRCIEEIERDFVDQGREVVFETVSPDGGFVDCVEGRTLNPGHAIEAAWFLLEEARHRGGDGPLVSLACRILDWSWVRGWDQQFGGLLYFVDVLGHPVQEYWHDMKFWWPHNETVLATLLAYAATGEREAVRRVARQGARLGAHALRRPRARRVVRLPAPGRPGVEHGEGQSLEGAVPPAAHAAVGLEGLFRARRRGPRRFLNVVWELRGRRGRYTRPATDRPNLACMSLLRPFLLVALSLPFVACADEGADAADESGAQVGQERTHTPEFDFAPGGPISDEQLAEFHVQFEVIYDGEPLGNVAFELWPEVAPRAVRRFLRHAAEGDYDGTPFHRVVREYIVQGGDPTGSGQTVSRYGVLPAEMTVDPAYNHGYGVITLIPSSSQQFYLCVAESARVWGLDEQEFSRLGKLSFGVTTLEQIANVPVGFGSTDTERATPIQELVLKHAHVVREPAPTGGPILRPTVDLQGEPEVVAVEQILVTFTDRATNPDLIRNRVEAEQRAQECFERIASGELSFEEALYEYTDDVIDREAPIPRRRMSNWGVLRLEGQRARLDANREMRLYQEELRQLLSELVISEDEFRRRQDLKLQELAERLRLTAIERREDMGDQHYARAAFALEVNQVGLVPYDPFGNARGWFLLRRVE